MQDNRCLVNNIAKQNGGKQKIMTPNGVLLPLIIKNELMYLIHYGPQQSKCLTLTEKSS